MEELVLAVRLKTIPIDLSSVKETVKNLWNRFLKDEQSTIATVRSSSFRGDNLDEILTKIGNEFLNRQALVGGLNRSTSPLDYYNDLKVIVAGTAFPNMFFPVFSVLPDPKILPLLQDPTFGSQLSIRARNGLLNSKVRTFAQLLGQTVRSCLYVPNMGRKSIDEINDAFDALIIERLGKKPSTPLIDSNPADYRPFGDFSPMNVRQQIQNFIEELDKQPDYMPPVENNDPDAPAAAKRFFNLAAFKPAKGQSAIRTYRCSADFAEATVNIKITVDPTRHQGNAFNAEINRAHRVAVDASGKLNGIFGKTSRGDIHLKLTRKGDNFTLTLEERVAKPA